MTRPVTIAVVGHTNAGKTSLMRTLLRKPDFGEVSARPGTTRHVEGGEILVGSQVLMQLFDTPGLEDSIGLGRLLKREQTTHSLSNSQTLSFFLDKLDQWSEFDQEAKVIRQLIKDDLVFYLIDVREPVLGKYLDELAILSMAAKPVIPVLNFTSVTQTEVDVWRSKLAERGLHAQVEFDTVLYRFTDEKRIYQKMQALMADRYDDLQQVIDEREAQRKRVNCVAQQKMAELLVNVAALRDHKIAGEQSSLPLLKYESLADKARKAEYRFMNDMLTLYGFSPSELNCTSLPIHDGEWELDLFDKDNLKTFGLNAGANAVKGAAIGVGFDAAFAGLTLGTATAIGAAMGIAWSAGRRYHREIQSKLRGEKFYCVGDDTLKVLWFRQFYLLQHLQSRGHAAYSDIEVGNNASANSSSAVDVPETWNGWLKKIRSHPEWCLLTNSLELPDLARKRLADEIATTIGQSIAGFRQLTSLGFYG